MVTDLKTTAVSWGLSFCKETLLLPSEKKWGKKKLLCLFFPSLSPTLLSPPLLFLFISSVYLFICISCGQEEPPLLAVVLVWCLREEGDATSRGDNTILQWSMKEQTFRSRGIREGGRSSEGILCTWFLFMAAWWLAVLMARYVGPQGVVKNHHGPGKGINARGSSGGDGFQTRPGADVQTAQHLPRFTSLTLAPVDGVSLWILIPKGVNASKNVGNPGKKNSI